MYSPHLKSDAAGARRLLIGYWHSTRARGYSHPQPLVDPAWERARRREIVTYLQSGRAFRGSGHSYCRFGCTQEFLLKAGRPGEGEYWQSTRSDYFGKANGPAEAHPIDESGWYLKKAGALLNGCLELCDDMWCWPEGLAHYVEVHEIRLPDEFVAHAAARNFEPAAEVADTDFYIDDQFWRDWCEANAPFEYERHCVACEPRSLIPARPPSGD